MERKHIRVLKQLLRPDRYDGCGCSFCPTSMSDFCDDHRPFTTDDKKNALRAAIRALRREPISRKSV